MATRHRHVFLTTDLAQASRAVHAARAHGTPDEDIHIVARSDIEVRRIHDRRKMADSDFIPGAIRGIVIGGIIGVLVAVLVMATHGGGILALALGALIGAAVGGLGASLMGAGIQDPVRRRFGTQIDAGNILVVIDEDGEDLRGTAQALQEVGAIALPYDAPTAMT